MPFSIDTPIKDIPRISLAYQKRLMKLGIETLQNLFYHWPHRYDDFSKITAIGDLKLNEVATVQGKIIEIKNIRTWRKKMFITEAYVKDSSGIIKAVWFNQPYLADTLKKDSFVSLSGKVNPVRGSQKLKNPANNKSLSLPNRKTNPTEMIVASNGVNLDKALYLSNPAYEKISQAPSDKRLATSTLRHTGRLVPVYPEITGLSSRYLRYLIQIFLPTLAQIKDWLPPEIKKSQRLLDLNSALKQIHFPVSDKAAAAAKRRLAFDELFLIQVFALQQKIKWQKGRSLKIPFDQQLIKIFVDRLPFRLTNAQRQAAWEIIRDLNKIRPMNRLLEGDVGSGKTVVAAIAALSVVNRGWPSSAKASDGKQVAFMAPTEILAHQHFKTINELFADYNIKIALLTGGEKSSVKKEIIRQIADGKIQIIIGTHALIQKEIKFKNLALAVVDEQHCFGVNQRAALQKNVLALEDGRPQEIPHLLSMTATPIPRTLALTLYGDLDISLLNEMPGGRQKIITRLVAPSDRQKAYEFVRQQVKAGRQVFIICPRIETTQNSETRGYALNESRREASHLPTSERRAGLAWAAESEGHAARLGSWDDVKAVKEEYKKLSEKIFPDLKIAMLHGKMKSKEKGAAMRDFKEGKTDVLVSTSVVEVGIDIPNATVMLIEGSERFGLAQLHQFRGRVGRGEHQSYCLLFTDSASRQTQARLKALLTCENGFELAEKDLAIRGPGEFFGTRQWGLPDLSMASLTDIELIKEARQEAIKILKKDYQLKNYPAIQEKLNNFQKLVHFE